MLRTAGTRVKYVGGRRLRVAAFGSPQNRFASTITENVQDYDLVIIGGGPVGLALGCALSELPHRVSLV